MSRSYASFFEWPDRERKELGVVEELVEALAHAGGPAYTEPAIHSPDPPDCTVRDSVGELIAFEVTELVSEGAVRRNAQGKLVQSVWNTGDVIRAVDARLSDKDAKTFNSGPFVRIAVALFTDEPLLTFAHAKRELESASFGPFRQIEEAYLLFSYDPGIKGYPVLSLAIRAPAPQASRRLTSR